MRNMPLCVITVKLPPRRCVAIDLLDDFFEEAEYHEFHGVAFGDAALHHVEEFFGIDIPRRGTVRALYIVG